MDTKKCSNCGLEKPVTEFYVKKTENRRTSWCPTCLYAFQKRRWRDRKKKAVELFGGCCCKCGYKRNYAAFDFHHVNPEEKDFNWKELRLRSWENIVEELKKCILVCKNCHTEIHNPEFTFDGSELQDNNFLNYELKPSGICPTCRKEVFGTKYCSTECVGMACRRVVRPDKDALQKLITEKSWCEIGRMYGVSDNAVRKWARSYKLLDI